MTNEYPLYPDLPEEAQELFVERMNDFKIAFRSATKDIIEEHLNDFYADLIDYVESDSWNNFRQTIVNGLTDYRTRNVQGAYDFKEIRRKMFEEYHDEIIGDLNQDLVEENNKLKKTIEDLRDETDRLRKMAYR